MRHLNNVSSLVVVVVLCAMVIVLSSCAWGIQTVVREHSTSGYAYSSTYRESATGTVYNLPFGAQCQVDSQCNSGYCHDNSSAMNAAAANGGFGICMWQQTPHYHRNACFHDSQTRGLLRDRYGRTVGELSSRRPGGCPDLYIPGSRMTVRYVPPGAPRPEPTDLGVQLDPDPVANTFIPVFLGTAAPMSGWIFDGQPWGAPYLTDGRNDVEASQYDALSILGMDKPKVLRAVRIGEDLILDGPEHGRDAGGKKIKYDGFGPPYTARRGDFFFPGYFHVEPPPPQPVVPGGEGTYQAVTVVLGTDGGIVSVTDHAGPNPLELYLKSHQVGKPYQSWLRAPPVPQAHELYGQWTQFYTTKRARFSEAFYKQYGVHGRAPEGSKCEYDRHCAVGLQCLDTGIPLELGECRTPEWMPSTAPLPGP